MKYLRNLIIIKFFLIIISLITFPNILFAGNIENEITEVFCFDYPHSTFLHIDLRNNKINAHIFLKIDDNYYKFRCPFNIYSISSVELKSDLEILKHLMTKIDFNRKEEIDLFNYECDGCHDYSYLFLYGERRCKIEFRYPFPEQIKELFLFITELINKRSDYHEEILTKEMFHEYIFVNMLSYEDYQQLTEMVFEKIQRYRNELFNKFPETKIGLGALWVTEKKGGMPLCQLIYLPPWKQTYFEYSRTEDGFILIFLGIDKKRGGNSLKEKDIIFTYP